MQGNAVGCSLVHFIMHPAQVSEAMLGKVHFSFLHIQICTRLLQEAVKSYHVYCTYKLKWKPLFDVWVLGALNI